MSAVVYIGKKVANIVRFSIDTIYWQKTKSNRILFEKGFYFLDEMVIFDEIEKNLYFYFLFPDENWRRTKTKNKDVKKHKVRMFRRDDHIGE